VKLVLWNLEAVGLTEVSSRMEVKSVGKRSEKILIEGFKVSVTEGQ
jgi:hypothetical protein